jgi:predicted nucleic acid-binding protein
VKWLVDTCILIDLLQGDHDFATCSADALDAKRDEGLLISPVTFVELAPSFNGNIVAQNEFLRGLEITCLFHGNQFMLAAAHRAWHEQILRKHAGTSPKRPIADVLIGAHALMVGGLITRNESDFRALYPNLKILNPLQSEAL